MDASMIQVHDWLMRNKPNATPVSAVDFRGVYERLIPTAIIL